MAVPEEQRPGRVGPAGAGAGNRPMRTSSPGYTSAPGYPGGKYSNRPILLQPRTAGDLPDADDEDFEDEEDTDLREILKNAPAWLVSTVFHMLLLIVLGLLAFAVRNKPADLQVEVTYAEDLGEQMEDASVLDSSSMELEPLPEQLITPPDLTPVDDPLAAPPELAAIDLNLRPNMPAMDTTIEGAPIGLALKGRQVGTRSALLKRFGGTAETEKAVEAGLAWLARQQRKDGTWSLQGPYEDQATSENVPAATAMALLAFQGHGDTHIEGKYAKVVKAGWDALLQMQRADGLFSGHIALDTQMLYTHAQCTIALCELYGMTKDSTLKAPADRALAYAVQAQDRTNGGWRYTPRRESDTSVTGWFVMAFQSARMADLQVPREVLNRVSDYLDAAQIDEGRRYGYLLTQQPTNAVCAEGLLCRQYLGWKQDDPRLIEGIGDLVRDAPINYDGGPNHDVYYWYYATQVAHHMEGAIWDEWNKRMRQIVPEKQEKDGPEAGSWSPRGDKWGGWNGRLYMTCLSIYMLEVYYRHLPIYSGYQFIEGIGKTMDPDPLPEGGDAAPEAEQPEGESPKTDEPMGDDKPAEKIDKPGADPLEVIKPSGI